MKKLKGYLFSMLSTVVLLTVFAVSIGYATFAEKAEGTAYARELVYNSTWLQILMALLIINLVGSIFRYNLVSRQKWSVLMFHLAFICILAGAAVTRYTGWEGVMHIREGKTTNLISTDKAFVKIIAENGNEKVEKIIEITSQSKTFYFTENISIGDKTFSITKESYLDNCVETILPDENGTPALSLVALGPQNDATDFTLTKGGVQQFENVSFAFGDSAQTATVGFFLQESSLYLRSSFPVIKTGMTRQNESELAPNTVHPAEQHTIYKAGNIVFVLKAFLPKARKNLTPVTPEMLASGLNVKGLEAIGFSISDEKNAETASVFVPYGQDSEPANCMLDNVNISVSYGMLSRKLPFSITLNAFELERYAGSESPSSYASEITVNDTEHSVRRPFRIYMNNILDYRGYRFFQASYDNDEKGTVLSVSKDFWGTLVTYVGYFLLITGMLFTLLSKNSRFRTVLKLSRELQQKRKAVKFTAAILMVLSGTMAIAAGPVSKDAHLKELNALPVQNNAKGRIEPYSTFASDILRKISRETTYNGQTAVEVLSGMSSDPDKWENEQIIKVAHTALAEELDAVNGFVSFRQMFDNEKQGSYRLKDKVEEAYRKPQTAMNKYDKEIMNLDERVNICYQIFSGNMPAFFPVPGEDDGSWSTVPPIAQTETTGLLTDYYSALRKAGTSGNWQNASKFLKLIKENQKLNGGANLPSDTKILIETFYNAANIFGKLAIVYMTAGMLFLLVYFLDIFKAKSIVDKILVPSRYVFLLIFVAYTAGLAARWYISEHAPWSNGYETMIFIGWAAALSGLVFSGRSPVTLAVTGILSAIALFVAGMSWMNPEITNLVPVLKSFWLIIHVAIITSSYGFLAMGALLGLLNLVLMIIRSKRTGSHLTDSITEIGYIIEMALTIGLVLLTSGCFIGGIWANESWGRYWGWDPKETWALVSILVYAVILHLRKIPKADNLFVLSSLSVLGFNSILMTFFGVNYYLSGMHSYAQGTPPAIPAGVYITVFVIFLLIIGAYIAERKLKST